MISYETDGALGIVTLDRPEKINAMTFDMRRDLAVLFERLADEHTIRAVLLHGAGRGFCAGADVGEIGEGGLPASRTRMRVLHRLIRAVALLDKPVVCAVHGVAVGIGWSLALTADIVIAGESARFAQIFRNLGLAPDGAACWLLARQVGPAGAREMVFSGRFVAAADALDLGLVSQVVPDSDLLSVARARAAELASGPTMAFAMAKRLFDVAAAPSLDVAIEHETMAQPLLAATGDFAEGARSFKEKRTPVFLGR